MYTTYALANIQSGKIYIGQTSDLESRIKRHNGILYNKANAYTRRNKGTWFLIYQEKFETRNQAIQRERELKSYQGRRFIKNILKNKRA